MTLLEWLPLASICLAGAASPGPSLAVVLGAAVGGGRTAGFAAAWAHAVGVGLYAAFTVIGISVLITGVPALFAAVQVGGALYLLWLARGLLCSSGSAIDAARRGRAGAARDGFAIAFLNPKLAVFMLALFSQFVRPGAPLIDSALLIATATLIDGLWYSAVTVLVSIPTFLDTLRTHARALDRVLGVLLALVALAILLRVALAA